MSRCQCTSSSCSHSGRCNVQMNHGEKYCPTCKGSDGWSHDDDGMGGIGGV